MSVTQHSSLRSWLLASAITVAFLLTCARVTQTGIVQQLAATWSWSSMLTGLALLQGEGLLTALRLRQLGSDKANYRTCLGVTARWVAALAVMPARLGEIYGLHLMATRFARSFGASLHSLFVQRLFDALVLVLFGIIAVAVASADRASAQLLTALAIVGGLLCVLMWHLPWCFACLAHCGLRWRRQRVGRALLRSALQGRRAARLNLSGPQPLLLGLSSIAKWLCNLLGVSLLLYTVAPPLRVDSAVTLAVIGNLAAVIPLSGLGGVGMTDLTVASGLAWYGLSPAAIASVTLCVRALLLCAPLLFALLVLLSEWCWPLVSAPTPIRDAR